MINPAALNRVAGEVAEAVAIANSTSYGLITGLMKDSGWGRSGPASMHDFTEIQWITTREGTGTFPI